MEDLDEIICDILMDSMLGVRSTLHMARQSGMTLGEVVSLADHAETPGGFVDALEMYAGSMPDGDWRVV